MSSNIKNRSFSLSLRTSSNSEDRGIAIRVNNLSKCYHIYETPRDRLKQLVLPRLNRLFKRPTNQYFREFWALNNISFEIKKGETVGIIGRNGAGKSTLLQMICGTLAPTTGSVEIIGRVAALLELGAGFNPEFTGRENVYLNATILGLTKDEVEHRFDEIASFADIGEFIDQPVKTYSSGMYVRLAFAVQACVDPDILIVDEALAVGDIGFQYKCFKRMEALRAKGVTIIMVTHSTGSVLEYADRCIVLSEGRLVNVTSDVFAAILTYEKGMLQSQTAAQEPATAQPLSTAKTKEELQAIQNFDVNAAIGEKRFGSGRAIIQNLSIKRADGTSISEKPIVKSGEELVFLFTLLASERISNVALGISLSKSQGGDVWGDNNINASTPITLSPGRTDIEYRVKLPISSGDYLVHCGLASIDSESREELDQRRPMSHLKFWSPREQVGVVHAPIQVTIKNRAKE